MFMLHLADVIKRVHRSSVLSTRATCTVCDPWGRLLVRFAHDHEDSAVTTRSKIAFCGPRELVVALCEELLVTYCAMGAFCGKDEDARALAMENPRAKILDSEPKKDTAAAPPAPAPAPAAAPPRRQSVKKTSMREGKAKASTVKESNISEVSHEASKTPHEKSVDTP